MSLPTFYLPHGGGPWPWIDGLRGGSAALRDFLARLPDTLPKAPKAILCVTAHWEASVPTVSTAASPSMLYDYQGFPPHTYEVTWPAPGAPDLARRVQALLADAGIDSAADASRGFDHGTFVPLAVAWPGADVPTVQLSLVRSLDPTAHLAVGEALRPLRDEGVLILASGMSYHSFPGFGALMRGDPGGRVAAEAQAFDDWMADAVCRRDRGARLAAWADAPAARACHPREEHLLPLMVAAGAAGSDPASLPFRDHVLGAAVSAVRFG